MYLFLKLFHILLLNQHGGWRSLLIPRQKQEKRRENLQRQSIIGKGKPKDHPPFFAEGNFVCMLSYIYKDCSDLEGPVFKSSGVE
jgi:hypothetical protein